MAVNFLDGISIDGLSTQGSESTALVINGSNVVGTRELGSNAFNSTTIPTNTNQLTNGSGFLTSLSGAVLTTGAQTVAGIKTFSSNTVFPGTDGGMEIGTWTGSTSYGFIGTQGMSGVEYCMLSDGTNTFLGAGTGGALKLRGPANDSSPEIIINGVIVEVNTGDLKVTDGSIAVGNITNSTTDGRIDASNDVVAFSTSDIRLKDNIKTIDNALDKVNSIQGIEFDWIEKEEVHGNSGHDIGVIAQEIEKILPDVVTTRDSGYKAVKYEKIVPLLIEAIKELTNEVNELKNK